MGTGGRRGKELGTRLTGHSLSISVWNPSKADTSRTTVACLKYGGISVYILLLGVAMHTLTVEPDDEHCCS